MTNHRMHSSAILRTACLLGTSALAAQPPIDVPTQFPEIQMAIDAAVRGQTVRVLVRPNGLGGQVGYPEHFVMKSGVSVLGVRHAVLGKPIVAAHRPETPIVRFPDPTIGRDTSLQGLKLINGAAERGAAIHISDNASPTILGNTITYQHAIYGAGLYAGAGASPRIERNIFEGCEAERSGGGIFLSRPGSGASIVRNVFDQNQAGSHGAGVCVFYGRATLWGNEFLGNRAERYGGGLFVYRTILTASFNRFADNVAGVDAAPGYGGGAALVFVTRTYFARNQFKENRADRGGGLYLLACELRARHLTFHGNRADLEGGGIAVMGSSGGPVSIEACDFRRNVAGTSPLTGAGGGILINSRQPATVVNCVFYRNVAAYAESSGCGIRIVSNPAPVVVNNTLVENVFPNGMLGSGLAIGSWGACWVVNNWFADHGVHVSRDHAAMPVALRHNRYTSNNLGQLNMHATDAVARPRFARPGVDFHCLPGDPGENQGLTGPAWVPSRDIDGQARSLFRVDIGADEIAVR